MDLVLCVNSDDITTGIRSTDGAGTMLADTVWEPTILADDLDKVELEMVDVGWKAADYTMLGDQGEVPVHVIYPDNYDPNRRSPTRHRLSVRRRRLLLGGHRRQHHPRPTTWAATWSMT